MDEFTLISRYFDRPDRQRGDVVTGIGDDAALCQTPAGMSLVVTTDMLVEGVHFPVTTAAEAVGHKALAVNLSDLAAMGAEATWFTLALAVPEVDEAWLEGFSRGLFALADRSGCELVGGDTVRGPRTVAIQAMGLVPEGQGLRRAGAAVGDRIYVSGTLGDAALGLSIARGEIEVEAEDAQYLRGRLDRPQPRLELGRALRGLASAAIDVSDGLVADLGHLLNASGVGARVRLQQLPLSSAYRALQGRAGWDAALSGGDDYELCFTVAEERIAQLESVAATAACELHCIGDIVSEPGLHIEDVDGSEYRAASSGHDHFRNHS
jgi:thiamine-monophosphate kinase